MERKKELSGPIKSIEQEDNPDEFLTKEEIEKRKMQELYKTPPQKVTAKWKRLIQLIKLSIKCSAIFSPFMI